jgi:hypothetical protein
MTRRTRLLRSQGCQRQASVSFTSSSARSGPLRRTYFAHVTSLALVTGTRGSAELPCLTERGPDLLRDVGIVVLAALAEGPGAQLNGIRDVLVAERMRLPASQEVGDLLGVRHPIPLSPVVSPVWALSVADHMGHGDEHHRRIAVTPFRVPISHALRAWDWRPPAARKHETRTRVADLSHASRRRLLEWPSKQK